MNDTTDLFSIRQVKALLESHGLSPKQGLGQNFLLSRDVVEDIAWGCCDNPASSVFEIGPGLGTLTRALAGRYSRVLALEIDRGLIPLLGETLAEYPNATVMCGDVMEVNLRSLLAPLFAEGPVAVCANLPYYITTPILMLLLESELPFSDITVMVQKEVADRLCASPGESEYGAITASIAYRGEAKRLFTVSAGNFLPPPKIESAVVRIRLWKEKPHRPADENMLFRVIKAAFGQRRKTLLNALSAFFPEFSKEQLACVIAGCGHRADIRGERLGIGEFCAISDGLSALSAR